MSERIAADQVNTEQVIGAPRRRSRSAELAWTELISPSGWWQIAIMSALMVALYWHELQRLMIKWTGSGDWSHGMVVPLFSLYFLHLQRDKLAKVTIRPSFLGLVPMLAGLLLFAYSIYPLRMGYPQSLSILIVITGIVLLLAGWRVLAIAWLPIAYLLFALPWPPTLYDTGTLPLRQLATVISAGVLEACPGIDQVVREGTIIRYVHDGQFGELGVAQACSGMRLLMAFGALGVAMAYVSERPWWHRVIMVLACVPIAVFCNMIRVTVTGLIHIYWDPTYAQGTAHTVLGLLMLFVAFGLFGGIGYVLNNLFVDADEEEVA